MPFDQSSDFEPRNFASPWQAARVTKSGHAKRTLLGTLRRWIELHRQRRELARLDDHLLEDIGLRKEEALSESQRWFWDDPEQMTSLEIQQRTGHRFFGQLARLRLRS